MFGFVFLLLALTGCDLFNRNTTANTTVAVTTTAPATTDTTETTAITTAAPTYTVSFEVNGGSTVAVITAPAGTVIQAPSDPQKSGYSFAGWYSDSALTNAFAFTTMPEGGLTLYAKWTPIDYTITFNTNGGSSVPAMTQGFGTEIVTPSDPTRSGYTFDGWYSDSALTEAYMFSTMPLNGLTVYAKWTPIDYTITFNSNGGSSVSAITQGFETPISAPTNPTKLGYEFGGWYTDDALTQAYTFSTMPLNGMTLYAKWNPALVNVTVNHYIESLDQTQYTLEQSQTLTAYTDSTYTATAISIPGFTHESDNGLDQASGLVLPDGSLVVLLYYTRNSVTISFESNADFSVASITDLYEAPVSAPEDPTRVGYVFQGWYADEDLTQSYTFSTMPAENITVYAKWEGVPSTLTFETNGGDPVAPITANNGEVITLPTPVRDGYDFVGWYTSQTFQEAFTDTEMPVGGGTIYAKWTEHQYTLTFETNGGSAIADATYLFGETIVAPADPTKTDFVFYGWFEDAALTMPYVFGTMPASDVTLYAKWIETTNPFAILLQIDKNPGDAVELEGIVYATYASDYPGFFVYDDTGFVFIAASHATVSTGDLVHVTGVLGQVNGIPFVQGVSDIQIVSSGNPAKTAVPVLLADLQTIIPSIYTVGNLYQTEGILFTDGSNYSLVDPLTTSGIELYYKSYLSDRVSELDAVVFDRVQLTYVLVYEDGVWQAAIVDVVSDPLTDAEKQALIQSMVDTYLGTTTFLPGSVFDVPASDPYGFATITYQATGDNASYFDSVNHVFLPTDVERIITFEVTLTFATGSTTFNVNVTLEPVTVSTILDVLNGTVGNYYQIQAIVVSLSDEMPIMVLKDATGFVYANNVFNLQLGDKVLLTVRKDEEGSLVYLDGEDGDIVLNDILSHDNELGLAPVSYSLQDLLALDPSDATIYGQYIELRGYLLPDMMGYHSTYSLVSDTLSVPVVTYSYSGFEKLMNYSYVEVYIRGFLYQDEQGNIALQYEGIRQDVRIPEYTDTERVDVIEQIFQYQFAGMTFESFQSFVMMPYHPLVGGTVTWQMDAQTAAVYDSEHQQFLYSETDVPLTFTITISEGAAETTLVFHSTLHAYQTADFDYLKQSSTYGEFFVRGIVAYWNPEYVYLIDQNGELLFVNIYGLDLRAGDDVLMYISMNHDYYGAEAYAIQPYDIDTTVLKTFSRSNPFTIPVIQTSVADILGLDTGDPASYTNYVEITGRLVIVNGYMSLQTADGSVSLDSVDEYTYGKLERLVGQYVTLRGFVAQYEYSYAVSSYLWSIRFVGMADDLVPVQYTDAEKLQMIQDYILANYQVTVTGDDTFDFTGVSSMFPSVSITYTVINDEYNMIDFSYGYDVYFDDPIATTVITIQVDLVAPEATSSFTFTFTINPIVNPTITPINDVNPDGSTIYTVEAQLIAMTRAGNDLWYLMVQDATGTMFVPIDNGQKNLRTIGDLLWITGTASYNEGRLEITPSVIEYQSNSSVSVAFPNMTLADILAMDPYDQSVYGLPVTLTGTVIREYGDNAYLYYLSNGHDRVLISSMDLYYGILNGYVGYEVTLQGFVFGVNPVFENNEMTVMVYSYNYSGTQVVALGDYADQDVVDMALAAIQHQVDGYNPALMPYEQWNYPSIPYVLQNAYPSLNLTYTFVTNGVYAEDYGYGFQALMAPENLDIVLQVDITLNDATASGTITKYLIGFTIGTLDDLFDSASGTPVVALQATVLYSGWGYSYYLIEGKVYYLDAYTSAWVNPGEQVYLVGRKNVINGVANYTYQIMLVSEYLDYSQQPDAALNNLEFPVILTQDDTLYFPSSSYGVTFSYSSSNTDILSNDGIVTVPIGYQEVVTLTVTGSYDVWDNDLSDYVTITKSRSFDIRIGYIPVTIAELYANDYETNPLQFDYLTVYGQLGYDRYMNMFTLTDENQMIYIRTTMDSWEGDPYLFDFVGENVYLNIMLPMAYVRNDIMLVDSIGDYSDLWLPTLTPAVAVETTKAFLESHSTIDISAGDSLEDVLMMGDYFRANSIAYTLVDEADAIYVDIDRMIAGYVSEDVTVQLLATITNQDGMTTDTVTLSLVIHPRTDTSIHDILWGSDDVYQTTGIVVAVVQDGSFYDYMIIDNGFDRILVYLDHMDYGTFGSVHDVAIGDEVRVIASRGSFDYDGLVPALMTPSVITTLSTGNTVVNTAVEMTFDDILALDYLNPEVYYQYIVITDRVISAGNYYYPAYALADDNYPGYEYELMLYGPDYATFNTLMATLDGETLSVTGYLIGMPSVYSAFGWEMIYESHVVIPTT